MVRLVGGPLRVRLRSKTSRRRGASRREPSLSIWGAPRGDTSSSRRSKKKRREPSNGHARTDQSVVAGSHRAAVRTVLPGRGSPAASDGKGRPRKLLQAPSSEGGRPPYRSRGAPPPCQKDMVRLHTARRIAWPGAAVLRYNCLPRAIASLVRRFLKIPRVGDFGDYGMVLPHRVVYATLDAFSSRKSCLEVV